MLPAATVPVATQIRCGVGHGHDVAGSGQDVAIAAGTQVRLRGLIGLEETDVDLVVVPHAAHPRNAHNTRAIATAMPAAAY
jgi:hypothetical protein